MAEFRNFLPKWDRSYSTETEGAWVHVHSRYAHLQVQEGASCHLPVSMSKIRSASHRVPRRPRNEAPEVDIASTYQRGQSCPPKRMPADDSSDGESLNCVATLVSWVSSPARATTQRCFSSAVVFQRPSGQRVRAAELCLRGGDVLLGPGGVEEVVKKVEKHAPQERDMVQIRTAKGVIELTGDHEILVEGPDGELQRSLADRFAQLDRAALPAQFPKIFDGKRFQEVVAVVSSKKVLQVVDVCFERQDAAVLAWFFTVARQPRTLHSKAAFACLGRQHSSADLIDQYGHGVSKTFIDGKATPPMATRSRSADARPSHQSLWSVGTLKHPTSCTICFEHHRHLQQPSTSHHCRKGASCQDCHAWHADVPFRADR